MTRKLLLIAFVCLFFAGSIFSTQAFVQGKGDCVRKCNALSREARQRCRDLNGDGRKACLREVKERHRACIANCRN